MIRLLGPAAIAAVLALTMIQPARAADDEMIEAQAGVWLVAPENGAKGCRLTFGTNTVSGGYEITGADACAAPLPVLAAAKIWNFTDDGSLAIADGGGKPLMRFQQEEGSPWESEGGDPTWLLPALGDVDHVPTTESLAGAWRIQTPDGKPVCDITLTTEKDQDGTAKMSSSGNCAGEVGDLKLSLWATEGFGLVMLGSDGSSLSFDMKPDGSFQKSEEEEGEPLLLVRK
ncbi:MULTISPECIES: AprI/Inh family metalloprotease inhibitor [unclassified Rhizobium]|uniref:AprI/Inh family metalloprotease inhibitor n=1 Tax=Rhizobium TaxID=379 RepID=UPI00084BE2C4|nr:MULTISPECIES: AprI/Inh family metalloprotease inhibitor [unclassified Rhizobium]OEC94940.1 metalloprotease [Rhizobium sp. YK2]QYA12135.1 AprI/Inh family metalloprotease inhibitor [Rhizobium sp. AB2/73]UEQ81934.1 AprI/Inh family metalloprotease inhibitor [Rhizobium sp. AB2/73]